MATLKPKEELFCRYYTQNDELFGNATLSYAEAFGYKLDELADNDAKYDDNGKKVEDTTRKKAYDVCSSLGHRLLRKVKIQERNTELLNEILKDDVVDSQLSKVILQDRKLDSKVAAIREYNKLKNRVSDAPQINFNIGSILETIERRNVGNVGGETVRQELPAEKLLLDQGQAGKASIVPKKQSSTGLQQKEA